jgi:hypothetical protein
MSPGQPSPWVARAGAAPLGPHALVVGGSGMLARFCRALASDGWKVTVVGRDRAKLARATAGDPRLHPLSVDYEDLPAFAEALGEATAARGPMSLVVCWIRSWAPESLRFAGAAVAKGGRVVHVLGSNRSATSAAVIAELKARQDLAYQQVQLGSVREGNVQRWLSDAEISAGVYAALQAGQPYYLVGTPPL